MTFLKEHLVKDYNWPEEVDISLYEGVPTRRRFDRYNGHQVLFIINFYASMAEKITLPDGRRMEELISKFLPLEARSEISVFNWLREAFKNELAGSQIR